MVPRLKPVFANANRGATVYTMDAVTGLNREMVLASGQATSVAAADFDGNGRVDLVFGSAQSKVVLFNTTPLGAALQFSAPVGLGASPTADAPVSRISRHIEVGARYVRALARPQSESSDATLGLRREIVIIAVLLLVLPRKLVEAATIRMVLCHLKCHRRRIARRGVGHQSCGARPVCSISALISLTYAKRRSEYFTSVAASAMLPKGSPRSRCALRSRRNSAYCECVLMLWT
jgi:hypothetical protein